jgi:L-threonate 2-dehydrogenase
MTPLNIGVVGIGLMGLPMALRLLALGHRVWVHDVDDARVALAAGCTVAANAAQLASACDVVLVVVVDSAQCAEVLHGMHGLLQARPLPQAVVLCPTIAAADTEALAAALHAQGVACIDAPMSGGPQRAGDGSMSLMVACAPDVYAQWQPLLAQLSSQLHHVSARVGDGARTKLVNNLLATINLAGACEVMALAGRLGLDAATTLSVIAQSSGQSWIGSERLARALAGDAAPRARMTLLAKDSVLALAQAREVAFSAPLGQAAGEHFAAAVRAGLGGEDDSALWRYIASAQAPGQSAP